MEDKEENDLEEVYCEEKAPKIHKFSFLKGFLMRYLWIDNIL